MAEWIVEHGIGEYRALLVDGGEALAARVLWPGELSPGRVIEAKLVTKRANSVRGVALTVSGEEVLVDQLPADVTEGGAVSLTITRGPIAERGRFKRAVGRIAQTGASGAEGFRFPMLGVENARRLPPSQFLDGQWEEIWQSASSGEIDFAGGSLLLSATPAMVLIDVDGSAAPRELALAAVPAIARAFHWFDLGGSIGIDFPTLDTKADRKAVDAALGQALGDWPHERTSMNGFGFVQIVARLEGPSLLHRFATSCVGMAARMALRRAEMLRGPGVTLLRVHPALKAKLKPEWLEDLARRTARPVRVETDPGLAIEAGQAQIVPA